MVSISNLFIDVCLLARYVLNEAMFHKPAVALVFRIIEHGCVQCCCVSF